MFVNIFEREKGTEKEREGGGKEGKRERHITFPRIDGLARLRPGARDSVHNPQSTSPMWLAQGAQPQEHHLLPLKGAC